ISSVSLSLLFFNDPPPTDISTLSLHDALPISLVMMAPLGHAGLAGASSVGAYVNLVALLWAARRRLGPLGGRALVASAARTLAASLPLLVWCGLAVLVWPGSRSLLVDVLWLGGTIAGAIGLFWSASVVLDLSQRTALLR